MLARVCVVHTQIPLVESSRLIDYAMAMCLFDLLSSRQCRPVCRVHVGVCLEACVVFVWDSALRVLLVQTRESWQAAGVVCCTSI